MQRIVVLPVQQELLLLDSGPFYSIHIIDFIRIRQASDLSFWVRCSVFDSVSIRYTRTSVVLTKVHENLHHLS